MDLKSTCYEFSLAEYASALEMIAAAKRTDDSALAHGFIRHALDEYEHKKFFSAIPFSSDGENSEKSLGHKRNPNKELRAKGYIHKSMFLAERYNPFLFSVFIAANEKRALNAFASLKLKLEKHTQKDASAMLANIIRDEQDHSILHHALCNSSLLSDEKRHFLLASKHAQKICSRLYYQFFFTYFIRCC